MREIINETRITCNYCGSPLKKKSLFKNHWVEIRPFNASDERTDHVHITRDGQIYSIDHGDYCTLDCLFKHITQHLNKQ